MLDGRKEYTWLPHVLYRVSSIIQDHAITYIALIARNTPPSPPSNLTALP